MQEVTRATDCLEATLALATGLASLLRAGDIVLLQGEMGSGKTTFTRGVMSYFNPKDSCVSSPTFVIVNQYPVIRAVHDITSVTHVDAYRISSESELDALGWDQLFSGRGDAAPGTVAIIEWPERIAAILKPENAIVAKLYHADVTAREFVFSLPDAVLDRPEARLFADREPVLCPMTNVWVSPTNPAYPFAHDRARMADLGKWMNGTYNISRPLHEEDLT